MDDLTGMTFSGLSDEALQPIVAAIEASLPDGSASDRASAAADVARLLHAKGAPDGAPDDMKVFVFIDFLRGLADFMEMKAGPEVADMGKRFKSFMETGDIP